MTQQCGQNRSEGIVTRTHHKSRCQKTFGLSTNVKKAPIGCFTCFTLLSILLNEIQFVLNLGGKHNLFTCDRLKQRGLGLFGVFLQMIVWSIVQAG